MDLCETLAGTVSYKFALALTNRKFEDAHQLLASPASEEWSVPNLRETYDEVIENLGAGSVKFVSIDQVTTEWPDKQTQDIGWVYVTFACGGDSEAVVATVCIENGKHLIRDLEWGRP